eukprot:jgi/Botrbrau1/9075/Bobra.178_2s0007.1
MNDSRRHPFPIVRDPCACQAPRVRNVIPTPITTMSSVSSRLYSHHHHLTHQPPTHHHIPTSYHHHLCTIVTHSTFTYRQRPGLKLALFASNTRSFCRTAPDLSGFGPFILEIQCFRVFPRPTPCRAVIFAIIGIPPSLQFVAEGCDSSGGGGAAGGDKLSTSRRPRPAPCPVPCVLSFLHVQPRVLPRVLCRVISFGRSLSPPAETELAARVLPRVLCRVLCRFCMSSPASCLVSCAVRFPLRIAGCLRMGVHNLPIDAGRRRGIPVDKNNMKQTITSTITSNLADGTPSSVRIMPACAPTPGLQTSLIEGT